MTISPHGGGELIDRIVPDSKRNALKAELEGRPSVTLNEREISDFEMISTGALSPLDGFMTREQYDAVVNEQHLAGGIPWTIPVTLSVSADEAASLKEGEVAALRFDDGTLGGSIEIASKWTPNKELEAEKILRTTDAAHPGVAYLNEVAGDVYVGGKINLLQRPVHEDVFSPYWDDPAKTRAVFAEKGWRTVVAFQTRNPIHRAHEALTKCALELVDGLLIHPLVGKTKADDVPASVRMKCYEVILDKYYNREHVHLSVNPAAMRYAGPAEAIFHAIVRRNYGCSHFIVGRDHAGVGNYYGTYDAQNYFDEFDADALGIQPMKFEHMFYSTAVQGMASAKTAPSHGERIFLSGTKVRAMLEAGELPPPEFSRPEVAQVLVDAYKNL